MNTTSLLITVIEFYSWLIIGYIILSWVPADGPIGEIRRVLATICEPYLGLFRRIIPPIGMMDLSPIVALIVLGAIQTLIARAF